jgi:hypothetical protein
VRKLIAAAACAAAFALAGSAATELASAPSTDLESAIDGEVAVEGITLDHEGFCGEWGYPCKY